MLRPWLGRLAALMLVVLIGLHLPARGQAPARPNVLFIAVDDLNDWITALDADNPVRTPNIQRLAAKGALFTHAYAPSPACNPSRVAVITGRAPSTSGVYGNTTDWCAALPDAETIPQHLGAHGYATLGAGKVFHHQWDGAFHDDASFEAFLPVPWPPDDPPAEKLNGIPRWVGGRDTSLPFDWGPRTYCADRPHPDVRTMDWVIDRLERAEAPFFLAAGVYRPHMPFYAPAEYFEAYPLGELHPPPMWDADVEDVPPGVEAGTVIDRPVTLTDLYPTLAELAGLPLPKGVDGVSLVPLLHDPDAV